MAATKLFWSWLHPDDPTDVSNSETLRNVGLLIGGALAFVFAGWRAWVAERQANASQAQVETALAQVDAAHRQAETAQQALLNERYQRGAEMLGHDVLAVRLGGIYALQNLAEEYPETHHIQVMRLLCAFVRNPTPALDPLEGDDARPSDFDRLREDVQAAMNVIGYRGSSGISIENQNGYHLDLSGAALTFLRLERADLRFANLEGAYLDNVHLPYCKLTDAILIQASLTMANLRFAYLNDSDLTKARLQGANMARAELDRANCYEALLTDAVLHGSSLQQTDLSGAEVSAVDFSHNGLDPAVGLTQNELDRTRRNVVRQPLLAGVVDPSTGDSVIWNRSTD